MRSYSQRSLTSLNGIHPDLRRVIDRALQDSQLDFAVIEGLRTRKRQEQLVASGASQTMNSRVPIIGGGDWTSFKDGPHFELDRRVYDNSKWSTLELPAQERTSATQSGTVRASAVTVASGACSAVTAVSALDNVAQYVVLAFAGVVVMAGLWIMRERLRKWAEGDR